MARYKLIRPTFEDPEFKLAKKREHIMEMVAGIWAVLMVVGIFIGGLNQANDEVAGWLLLVLGVVSLFFTLFCLYTIMAKWEPLLRGDDANSRRYKSKDREKRVTEAKFVFGLLTFLLAIMSIAMLIVSILRLCEIA